MTAPDATLMVYCTCPDVDTARRLAERVIADRLAACVNVLGGVESLYWWDGAVACDPEVLLLAKTTTARFEALRDVLVAHHPYELPEVVAVEAAHVLPDYARWVADSVRP